MGPAATGLTAGDGKRMLDELRLREVHRSRIITLAVEDRPPLTAPPAPSILIRMQRSLVGRSFDGAARRARRAYFPAAFLSSSSSA